MGLIQWFQEGVVDSSCPSKEVLEYIIKECNDIDCLEKRLRSLKGQASTKETRIQIQKVQSVLAQKRYNVYAFERLYPGIVSKVT